MNLLVECKCFIKVHMDNELNSSLHAHYPVHQCSDCLGHDKASFPEGGNQWLVCGVCSE